MSTNNACLGVVLAGGLSSRMGQNKAELPRTTEQNMLAYSSALLQDAGASQIVHSINFQSTPTSSEQLADNFENLGPLGGIATTFLKAPHVTGYLFLPVDLPLLTPACLAKIRQVGELSKTACHYDDHFLPLYLPRNAMTELFFSQLLARLQNGLTTGKKDKSLSIKQMLKQIPNTAIALEAKNKQQLFNCNTPEQWREANEQMTIRVS